MENEKSKEILNYIDVHGIEDKDGESARKRKKRSVQKGSRENIKVVDLHGKRAQEATSALRNALHKAKRDGYRKIRVIHGVGHHSDPSQGPVLKKLVRSMLEKELSSYIRDYRADIPRNGGEGATIIRLI